MLKYAWCHFKDWEQICKGFDHPLCLYPPQSSVKLHNAPSLMQSCLWLPRHRARFKEKSSLHISIAKARLQFMNDLFYKKILFIQPNLRMTLFVAAQTAFHHCTFRFITAHSGGSRGLIRPFEYTNPHRSWQWSLAPLEEERIR